MAAAPDAASLPDFDDAYRASLVASLGERDSRLPPDYARSLAPIAFQADDSGRSITLSPDARGSLSVELGQDSAATVVELSRDSWHQFSLDLESSAGLVYGERAHSPRGDLMDLLQWEPALRWLFTERPVYDPDTVDLRDEAGRVLDPTHGFTLDDDREEMASFLRTVGYLWVRDVFSQEEVQAFRAAGERLRAAAREGDQESWWGKREDGDAVLCRVIRAGKEPVIRALHGDPRIEGLAALADVPMEHKQGPEDKDGIAMLWKQAGVSEGLGDLPWHRDCGMGGHASMCPTAVVSVFLGENTKEAGQLRFLPGSWRSSFPFADGDDATAPRGVAPPAKPGDVTFHYGDGLHVAPPPTGTEGPFRSCILMGYGRVGGGHHRGGRHYNDVLLGADDGQVKNMRTVARQHEGGE